MLLFSFSSFFTEPSVSVYRIFNTQKFEMSIYLSRAGTLNQLVMPLPLMTPLLLPLQLLLLLLLLLLMPLPPPVMPLLRDCCHRAGGCFPSVFQTTYDKCRAIKGLVVCYDRDHLPLDLLSGYPAKWLSIVP